VLVVDMVQMKFFLEQTNILIDSNVLAEGRGVDGDVLLAYRFDEAHFGETLLEAAHQGEGGCGLADVLFGRRDEDGTRFLGGE